MSDEISLLPLGGIIQHFKVAGIDIVQGFPTQEQYVRYNRNYFGETIGRVANRISGAEIKSLNGRSYPLAANNGPNSLHGGLKGWGKQIWDGPTPVGLRKIPGVDLSSGGESVKFTLNSPDGDQGFPGEVLASIIYTTGKVVEDGAEKTVLAFEYEAELLSGAEETLINMTNHSYFNISDAPSIAGTEVQLCTAHHLPVDSVAIPTGGPTPFPTVATDKPFTLGPEEPAVDHCFIVDPNADASAVPLDTRSQPLTKLITAHNPSSKLHLEVLSTEPAFQFYTGAFINIPAIEAEEGVGPAVPARGFRSAFCVEPSRFVNAANVDEWKGQVLLKKGMKYGARNVYKAWKA